MSRTVADTALLLQVLAGPDSRDPNSIRETPPDFSAGLSRGVEGMRIAWSSDYGYAGVDPEVVEIAARAARVFEELGAIVEDAPLKLEDPFDAFFDVFATAAFTSYGHMLEEHRHEFSPPGLYSIEHGSRVTGAGLSRAIHQVDRLGRQMEDFFDTYDLLLSPTMPTPAFEVGTRPAVIGGKEVDPQWGFIPFTYPINMTGQTAASIPCGFSSDGLPIGLHIIGPRRAEARVLQASAAFEAARPWADKIPAGFE
jgi:aspartyl-tRNA(Asn)/glutamyl-tRNA(Gln) amidotransferase subunit A